MAMTLITTNTSSNAASSSFTSSIDSTYKLYIFKFYDVNPATDGADFTFQANATDSTSYDETITSTSFMAQQNEADGSPELGYLAGSDQAQGTAFQHLSYPNIGNGGDESAAGELFLFNPSNTTYVKHFFATTTIYEADNANFVLYVAGYFNTTTAIDDIQFKMSSGNMDGVIKMYGVA